MNNESYKNLANSQVDAMDKFAEFVVKETDCDKDTAYKVYDLYMKNKLMKTDAIHGTFHVKHGAYLEADVLKNAIAQVV